MTTRPLVNTPEQRSALRIPANRVPSIEGVRISPGDVVSTLVNISTSGALVECTSKPRPGSTVSLHFIGTFTPATIKGRVARTIVASLGKDGLLRYMVGIAFEQPIALDESVVAVAPAAAPTPTPAPAPMSVAAPAPAPEPVEAAPKLSTRLQNRW